MRRGCFLSPCRAGSRGWRVHGVEVLSDHAFRSPHSPRHRGVTRNDRGGGDCLARAPRSGRGGGRASAVWPRSGVMRNAPAGWSLCVDHGPTPRRSGVVQHPPAIHRRLPLGAAATLPGVPCPGSWPLLFPACHGVPDGGTGSPQRTWPGGRPQGVRRRPGLESDFLRLGSLVVSRRPLGTNSRRELFFYNGLDDDTNCGFGDRWRDRLPRIFSWCCVLRGLALAAVRVNDLPCRGMGCGPLATDANCEPRAVYCVGSLHFIGWGSSVSGRPMTAIAFAAAVPAHAYPILSSGRSSGWCGSSEVAYMSRATRSRTTESASRSTVPRAAHNPETAPERSISERPRTTVRVFADSGQMSRPSGEDSNVTWAGTEL
jgi:hypothetical protein